MADSNKMIKLDLGSVERNIAEEDNVDRQENHLLSTNEDVASVGEFSEATTNVEQDEAEGDEEGEIEVPTGSPGTEKKKRVLSKSPRKSPRLTKKSEVLKLSLPTSPSPAAKEKTHLAFYTPRLLNKVKTSLNNLHTSGEVMVSPKEDKEKEEKTEQAGKLWDPPPKQISFYEEGSERTVDPSLYLLFFSL